MDRIQKLNSKQGSFDAGASATKIFADFTIPSGVYNMKDSYINVALAVNNVDNNVSPSMPTSSGGQGVHANEITLFDSNLQFGLVPNVALVKNAFMSGSKVGKIDDVRRVDALKTSLSVFERDINTDEDRTYYGMTTITSEYAFSGSQFIEQEKVGTNKSVNVVNNVRINMSDIFDICNEKQLDTNLTGNLDIHLELNLDRLRTSEVAGYNNAMWNQLPAREATTKYKDLDATLTATAQNLGTILTTQYSYSIHEFKEQSPFWVGQKLNITSSGGTGAGASALTGTNERTITEIVYNANGTISITLDTHITSAPLAVGDTITAIEANGAQNNSSIQVHKVEMVLHNVSNPQNVPTSYSYFTYPLEQDNISRTEMNKNYMVDGESQNVYVSIGDISPVFSDTTGVLEKYRFSLNGVDLTNRDLVYGSSESNDLVVKTYQNNQRQLKNITKTISDTSFGNDTEARLRNAFVLMTPLVQRDDNQQSILGLSLSSTTGYNIGDIKIFQEKVKTI